MNAPTDDITARAAAWARDACHEALGEMAEYGVDENTIATLADLYARGFAAGADPLLKTDVVLRQAFTTPECRQLLGSCWLGGVLAAEGLDDALGAREQFGRAFSAALAPTLHHLLATIADFAAGGSMASTIRGALAGMRRGRGPA